MHQDHGCHRQAFLAKPVRRIQFVCETQPHQHPGNHAVNGIQYPLPSNRAQGNRSDPGQQDEKTQQAAPPERLFQRNRKNVGTDQHNGLRHHCENDRVRYRFLKAGAMDDAAEILQPYEMQFGAADAGVTECIENSEKKRNSYQQQDIKGRRAEHGRAQQWTGGRACGLHFFPAGAQLSRLVQAG